MTFGYARQTLTATKARFDDDDHVDDDAVAGRLAWPVIHK